ncbi:uncharacterized protein PHACADRAFT_254904 [Phanerochaete carnosa HHB-10118-sp]|uniref:Uncharacterized protein n=1 Tax=Phanerochaete carnosa (strain HHB-10118-sp) TaxID=650164 RepID=K5V3T0_PHACS|nr:uncharacterized protein PHACADRAFT_254904 [Phanerochaete carnosa HHB-10118-sp]EKM57241.1 hypothetical protein PHACADRAFT_254904 [Phanerochaete carnosa HHB-10118-sp]
MWLAVRSCAALADPDSVVKSSVSALANALSVENAALVNGTVSAGTGTVTRVLFPALSFTMGDLFSLSFLQILSVLSFLTSALALVRVGSVSFHRLSHKFEAQTQSMGVASDNKAPIWNWSIGGSFSLGALIGEDEEEELCTTAGYTGGSELMRMDWQMSKPVTVHLPPRYSQPPISMAKLIMQRHFQRKPNRYLRRVPSGSSRPVVSSRLTQSA